MNRKIFDLLIEGVLFVVFAGCSLTSKPVKVSAPDPVTDLEAVSEEGKIVLTWTDPASKNLFGIKIYNGEEVKARTVSLGDGILVGAGIGRYEITNLTDGATYTFAVTAVNTDLMESTAVISNEVSFKLKVNVKEKIVNRFICSGCGKDYDSIGLAINCCEPKEITNTVTKYVCPVDQKDHDSLEEAAECCGVQYIEKTVEIEKEVEKEKIVEVEKTVYKFVCPVCEEEFDSLEEAAECCGVQTEYVDVEVEKIVNVYICVACGKEYETSEEAADCCDPEVITDTVTVTKYICPRCETEYDTVEEAVECCGPVNRFICSRCETEYDTAEEASACCGPECKFICPIDGKEFDSLEEVMNCCSDKIHEVSSVKEGSYTVYHLLQKLSGGISIFEYSMESSESEVTVSDGADLEDFAKSFEGFEAASLVQHGDNLYVFYNRKLITYTYDAGVGSFENGESTCAISGLYGARVEIPSKPSGENQFIRWLDDEKNLVPSTYGVTDITFNAAWSTFAEVKSETYHFYISSIETTNTWWTDVYNWAINEEKGYTFVRTSTSESNLPVVNVSWKDIIVWCNAASEKAGLIPCYEYEGEVLKTYTNSERVTINPYANGYRLPNIEEWQLAAKGGEDYLFSGSNNPDDVSWYGDGTNDQKEGNSRGAQHEVMLLAPNGYGLYDMSGNAWEWIWDLDPESSYGATSRKMCGGSAWGKYTDSYITSYQSREPTKTNGSSFSFRLVRNIPVEE